MIDTVYKIWSNAPSNKSTIAFASVLRLHRKKYSWTKSPDEADIWCLSSDEGCISTAEQLYGLLQKKPAVAVLCKAQDAIPKQWLHMKSPVKASYIISWFNQVFSAPKSTSPHSQQPKAHTNETPSY